MKNTPSLDRLANDVRRAFPTRVRDVRFRLGLGYPAESTAPPAIRHLQSDTVRGDTLVLGLHPYVFYMQEVTDLMWDGTARMDDVVALAEVTGIDIDDAIDLYKLLGFIQRAISSITREHLDSYDNAQIGAVLAELYRITEVEFDETLPDNEDDYSFDEALPEVEITGSSPHGYLESLIWYAVVARLTKRHGRELMLEWVDAVAADA